MTPITVTSWPDEATRTPNSACAWVAETMVEGCVYVARSRHGTPTELARQLVTAGLADRPMTIHYRGRAGTMTYRSFHAAALWTIQEDARGMRRVRYAAVEAARERLRRRSVQGPKQGVSDPAGSADALEEAGVTDAGLLGHLRGPGPHVRGCHVLDLVLGRG